MRSRGFTLLELVLAMTAMALLAAICYGAFHVAIRAVERGEVAVVSQQRLRVVFDLLIRQVKSAVATVPAGRSGKENDDPDLAFDDPCPYFVGGRDYLSFLTAAGMLGGGGLSIATYRILTDPPRLVFEEHPWPAELPDRDVAAGARVSVALEGFEDAWFDYHPPMDAGEPMLDPGHWPSRWDSCDDESDHGYSLPAAVRLTVRHLPGLEVDQFSQEIPTMLASNSRENAEAEAF
jgi:prepilin-type N-terminal cleavage/methylation domain-containing protein